MQGRIQESAPVDAAGDLASYSIASKTLLFYRGTDNHVHELWYDTTWHHADLTAQIDGSALAASDLVGYAFGTQALLFYRGPDDHIYELWYDTQDSIWHHDDLTVRGGGPPAKGDLAGYIYNSSQQLLFYRGTDNHVHELWYDTTWHHADVSCLMSGSC